MRACPLVVAGLALMLGPIALRAQNGSNPAKPPPQAAEVGYTKNTFASHLSEAEIDFTDSGRAGFRWYVRNPFGGTSSDPKKLMIFEPDGSLTITWGSIWTAATKYSPGNWAAGVAFGGGGYFEAELKFNPDEILSTKSNWWPSFWSVALEHLARMEGEQWPGMPPGYAHFTEIDFFEFSGWWKPPAKCCYAGTVNDWYGIWNETCQKGFCVRNNNLSGKTKFKNFLISFPPETDFSKYHRYGVLWVPATDTTPGYIQYYFDGKPTSDRVSWSKYSDQPPPPGDALWTFGILDKQHLVVTLGTGKGRPLTIKSVNVWQSSNDHNLTR